MELVRLDDVVAFRRLADPLLLENEAANNLALGVSGVAGSSATCEEFHGSNSVYRRVGYGQIAESAQYSFIR